jgi:hypothetical protein
MQRKRMSKERINVLCKDLNSNNYTSITDVMSQHKMGRQSYLFMQQAGILWKKGDYWRGLERIHDDRFLKYQKCQQDYFRPYNHPSQPTLFTKTKVKVDPKKVIKVEPRKVTSRTKPTLGIVQRLKVLFTGKL